MIEWYWSCFPVIVENLHATAPFTSYYCPQLHWYQTQGTWSLQYTTAAIFYAATFSFIQQAILVAQLM